MSYEKSESGCCILIADDDADDQFLIKEAFASIKFNSEIVTVENGEELLDYLNKRGKYKGENTPTPKVILLDLNMPKKDGRECLKEIKGNPKLKKIPVVIFSTSSSPDDIASCYELGASGYMTKPSSYSDLMAVMEIFKNYWFTAIKTPITAL